MATVYLSPVGNGFQWLTTNALSVLAGGKINTYLAGTVTPAATFTDVTGATPNANPIILDASGRATNEIWFTAGQAYKFVITDASNVVQFPLDNLYGINDPALPVGNFITIANLADTTNVANGDALVGTKRTETGAVATTTHSWIQEQVLNVFDFMTIAQIADVQSRTASIDVTAAINTADVAATAGKKALYIPGGKYSVTALTLNAPRVYGDGWLPGSGTQIHGSTAADNIITLPTGAGQIVENLVVTSAIAAGSRTNAGIKITGGAQILLRCITSNGHKYGFWNQGQGNEFEHCFAQSNNSHGFFFDGSVLAQNEIGCYICQSNGNTGNGFELATSGTGLRFNFVTAYSNGGVAFHAGTGVTDMWLVNPEMGGSPGGIICDSGTSDIQITNPFIEGISNNACISISGALVSITGGFVQGCTNAAFGGISVNNSDICITGVDITSNNGFGIRLGASSSKVVLSALAITNTAATGFTTTVGILIDPGAAAISMSACDIGAIATPISGNIPANSKISAVQGVVSTQGPAAMTFLVSPGTTVAAATTTYLSSAGNTNTADVNFWKVPFAGTLRNLYVESGVFPGAGQTFTYTVRKGAVDQTITAQLAGAAQSTNSDTTHTVSVAAGDRIAVKLVTSAGAGVGAHWCGLELERSF